MVFIIACMIKCYSKSYLEDSNGLQFTQIYSAKKSLKQSGKKGSTNSFLRCDLAVQAHSTWICRYKILLRLDRKESIESLVF